MKKNKKLTFVIPTKNRSNFLSQQLIRCNNIFRRNLYNFLIVDASNNYFHKKNKELVKNINNIKLFRQKSKGIQRGCFETLSHIKTEFVSFLYDDDELGQYIADIHKNNFNNKKIFSFGYGVVKDLRKKVKFKRLKSFSINKKDMLLAYNGLNINKFPEILNKKQNITLPLSPICTSYNLKFLFLWKKIVLKFVKKNDFRNFFLLKKEIGPDLLIYLISIANSKKNVQFFTPFTAKFSSHEKSISVIYGSNLLRIGYWLSRICFLEQKIIKDNDTNNKIYTYLVLTGTYLLFYNILNPYYFKNIFFELNKIINKKSYNFSFNYFKSIIVNRLKK